MPDRLPSKTWNHKNREPGGGLSNLVYIGKMKANRKTGNPFFESIRLSNEYLDSPSDGETRVKIYTAHNRGKSVLWTNYVAAIPPTTS